MNIILPGVMRCGTTFLRHYLSRHPSLHSPKRREIEYFSLHYGLGETWYQLQLSRGGLDKSPNYMANPEVPARIAADLPDAKVVILLRNPVDRAWSHYRWLCQNKHMTAPFSDLFRFERLSKGWYSVLRRGHYAEQLSHWFEHIPREQILIVKSERLWESPHKVYDEIVWFLGLPEFLPKGFRKHGTVKTRGDLSKQDRKILATYYEPRNAALYDLLEKDMGWK